MTAPSQCNGTMMVIGAVGALRSADRSGFHDIARWIATRAALPTERRSSGVCLVMIILGELAAQLSRGCGLAKRRFRIFNLTGLSPVLGVQQVATRWLQSWSYSLDDMLKWR
jgi:hypothetical protein